MVAINSLTYLLYSFLTLAANDRPADQYPAAPTSDWKPEDHIIWSDPDDQKSPTSEWKPEDHIIWGYPDDQDHHAENCPSGEIFDECEGSCQRTCKNGGKNVICPKMCVPGCLCAEGTLRGDDGKCVPASQCPSTEEGPVTPYYDKELTTYNDDWRVDTQPPRTWSNDDDEDDKGRKLRPVAWPIPVISDYEKEEITHPPVQPLSEQDRPSAFRRRSKYETVSPYGRQDSYQGHVIGPEVDDYTYEPTRTPNANEYTPSSEESRMLNGGGCPDITICTENCKRHGFKYAMCIEEGNTTCLCINSH